MQVKLVDVFGLEPFSYANYVDRFFLAMLGIAFAETAERFKGTVLGDFCAFVSEPGEELKGKNYNMQYDLLFNNSFSGEPAW